MTPAQRAAVLRRRPSLDAQVQALFAGGKVGGMWDMGDIATLYQQYPNGGTAFDVVTTLGQGLGTTLDKSKKSSWTDNTGSTWTKSSGDGVVTVVGNVITITGATTTTRVDRVGGTIQLVAGIAVFDVTAGWASATGPIVWCRGAPQTPPNGTAQKIVAPLAGSTLERVQIDSGTATFTINSLKYWEGNHATQPTAGWLPLYQVDGGYGCAQFDGINDLLSTAAIDLSASDKAVFSIAFAPNNFTPSILAEFGPNAAGTDGSFYLSCGEHGAGSWAAHARATTYDQVKNVSAITAGVPVVITVAFDLSSDVPSSRIIVRVNGAVVSTAVTYDQTGSASNFTSQIMNFGARAAGLFPSNSKIFSAALIGGALTVPEIELLDRWTRSTVGL